MSQPKLHIAIPLMDEMDMISEIISVIESQSYSNYDIYVCVNQPDNWWSILGKKSVCINNHKTIEFLNQLANPQIIVIDKSGKGKGWDSTNGGAGWARKVIMDQIVSKANDDDLIVSLDGDTVFGEGYFESIVRRFEHLNKRYAALCVPYYHKLTGDHLIDRALLRYEIYMRYYLINMLHIKSPYAFTALGSAMVVPVWAYNAVSGITPVKNGEDFYFLQKLRKYKTILTWNSERVYPSGRLSERVDFGTGPAIKAGINGNWKSYPIYDHTLFDKVKATYDLFTDLYHNNVSTPMSDFLKNQFKTDDIWLPLRKNYKDISRFIHACECKVDGLRILQFLRASFDHESGTDELRLVNFLNTYYQRETKSSKINLNGLSFAHTDLVELNRIRDMLVQIEDNLRQSHDSE